LTTKVGQAIIAVEDERFLRHHGIGTPGLIRAVWSTLTGACGSTGSLWTRDFVSF
jgi:membrane peptidoglycan carboxypeptidase